MAVWFRVDANITRNAKVALLSSDSVRWTYVAVLAEAKLAHQAARWASVKHLAVCLPGRPAKHFQELIGAGLLVESEDGSVTVHDWEEWQSRCPSDPTTGERQRRYRNAHSNGGSNADSNGRPDESNATVTPLRNGQTETETETETERKSRKGAKPPQAPLTRRPTDPPHPVVEAYRQAAHRYPPKALHAGIVEAVGDKPERVQLWGQIVLAWVAHGWNPGNVAGMLEAFSRGGIEPHAPPKRAGETQAQAAIRAYIEEERRGHEPGDLDLPQPLGGRLPLVALASADDPCLLRGPRRLGPARAVASVQGPAQDLEVLPVDR